MGESVSSWRTVCVLAGAVLQAACASFSDEGAIDYRKAQPATSQQLKVFHEAIGNATNIAQPLILSPLLRKDVQQPTSGAMMMKLDKVSIRLRDGFVRDCNESWRSVRRRFDKNCEIGVLFRAFNLGDGQDFDFKPGAERGSSISRTTCCPANS